MYELSRPIAEKNLSVVGNLRIPKLGQRAREMTLVLDGLYGPANWAYCWVKGERVIDFGEVCGDYETSYLMHFKDHPDILSQVLKFGGVYDTSTRNVEAGLDYNHRDENASVHLQDTAIRNIVAKGGLGFTPGAPLLQIRTTSDSEVGRSLSPFNVPFHSPQLILPSDGSVGSWLPDSVEAFYQSNRRLAVPETSDPSAVTALRTFINTAALGL